MAELQWVIEVRCVNTLLAEMKIDQKGQHICLTIPDRTFDPAEFDKLIEGLEVSSRIAQERRDAQNQQPEEPPRAPLSAELGTIAQLERREGLYEARILNSGELVTVNVLHSFLAPSELERFTAEMKAIRSHLVR